MHACAGGTFHLTVMVRWEMLAVVHEREGRCAHEGCVQPPHRTAADIESELSLLKTVRDVLVSRGALAPGPTALEESLRRELESLREES
ncbi:hypothetical protein BKG80_03725 [Mycobacteroides chelonae]|uniref:hypothetical protein n=1 Tax=Mycobacteroides chelonae TaxID=1774 RepID=UPI0008A88E1A|nr:hypothetical protein [Mycobacteroides chelonae]MBF9349942.1 hypothetical protein [Mycobacteroides chelonae]OHU42060.1 hypothetical protein BKG80_03725 [Mycobacteroides chelonae]